MSPTIEVSRSIYDRLGELAGQLFTREEVLERLLSAHLSQAAGRLEPGSASAGSRRIRVPRERGVEVTLAGQRISAVSVRDLYAQALRVLVDGGYISKIEKSIPFRTSAQRFLIAKRPTHPNANDFVVPVPYKGYFMEAHKNYENALSGLSQLCKVAGAALEY